MALYHIVAMAENRVIGNGNRLPWPKDLEDLRFFKATTSGSTVLMGRKTFESIGKVLPNRDNFVLSHSQPTTAGPSNLKFFRSLGEALRAVKTENTFVIGGASLYAQTIHQVDGIYLTKIPGSYQGDRSYPVLPPSFKENEERTNQLRAQYQINVVYLEHVNEGTSNRSK